MAQLAKRPPSSAVRSGQDLGVLGSSAMSGSMFGGGLASPSPSAPAPAHHPSCSHMYFLSQINL